jgi:hypothetical protein
VIELLAPYVCLARALEPLADPIPVDVGPLPGAAPPPGMEGRAHRLADPLLGALVFNTLRPAGQPADTRLPAVVLVHGHEIPQFLFETLAEPLVRAGYVVVAVWLRGLHSSVDSPLTIHYLRRSGLVYALFAYELARITQWIDAQPGVDPARKAAIFHSGGASAAPVLLTLLSGSYRAAVVDDLHEGPSGLGAFAAGGGDGGLHCGTLPGGMMAYYDLLHDWRALAMHVLEVPYMRAEAMPTDAIVAFLAMALAR